MYADVAQGTFPLMARPKFGKPVASLGFRPQSPKDIRKTLAADGMLAVFRSSCGWRWPIIFARFGIANHGSGNRARLQTKRDNRGSSSMAFETSRRFIEAQYARLAADRATSASRI